MSATAKAQRPVHSGGWVPPRIGPAGEHRRLTAARDAALRSYRRWLDDDAAREYARAQDELDAFVRAHPELKQAG